jgi:hypothetical protein
VSTKRNHLKDFYLYVYERETSETKPFSFSVGHGAFDANNFKKAVAVFQYDQINPVLSQELNFKSDQSKNKEKYETPEKK